ncbi:MAG: hypothetical protein JWR80_5875 [Bradyrhizobium sp.]|nr:hypothetical protein [Bradyrhizobium sp.]
MLEHGEGEGRLSITAADRLAAVAAASPLAGSNGDGVLEHQRSGLRAQGVVGVVVADDDTLEILPKIDGPDGDSGIRRRLIHMLGVALDIDIDVGALSGHDHQRDTLLEILIRLFSVRLVDAVRRGMPRRYVAAEDELPNLRGRLNAVRQFSVLAANPARLACRFDDLSSDIAINRIMKAAVLRLNKIARASDNRRRLAELTLCYADITDISAQALPWRDVVIDRTNARWRALLDLARLLLGERFQTTSIGAVRGFSLLFEMSTLFEEYVARKLTRALASSELRVITQGGRLFCLERPDGKRLFQTRPDILIKRHGRIEQIIDTKWKRVTRAVDDPKHGVAQSDIYQMMAYGRLYDCTRLTLLYPHHIGLDAEPLRASHHVGHRHSGDILDMATIDLNRPGDISGLLRSLVETANVTNDIRDGSRLSPLQTSQ